MKRFGAGVALFLAFIACGSAHSEEVLVFGITPWETAIRLKQMYRPLLNYVEEFIGVKVDIVIPDNYPALERMMKEGKIHIGGFSPVSYVVAKGRNPEIQYVATCTQQVGDQSKDSYLGIILVRKDSPFHKIRDLKNHRIAFTHRTSASGYIYPIELLKNEGITQPGTYFKDIIFLDKHPLVTDAVATGQADAGATWESNLFVAVKKHGDIFRTIAQTKPIPFDAYAVRGVSEEMKEKIQTAFLSLPPEVIAKARKAGLPYTGWKVQDDSFYDSVREVSGFSNMEKRSSPVCFLSTAAAVTFQ